MYGKALLTSIGSTLAALIGCYQAAALGPRPSRPRPPPRCSLPTLHKRASHIEGSLRATQHAAHARSTITAAALSQQRTARAVTRSTGVARVVSAGRSQQLQTCGPHDGTVPLARCGPRAASRRPGTRAAPSVPQTPRRGCRSCEGRGFTWVVDSHGLCGRGCVAHVAYMHRHGIWVADHG